MVHSGRLVDSSPPPSPPRFPMVELRAAPGCLFARAAGRPLPPFRGVPAWGGSARPRCLLPPLGASLRGFWPDGGERGAAGGGALPAAGPARPGSPHALAGAQGGRVWSACPAVLRAEGARTGCCFIAAVCQLGPLKKRGAGGCAPRASVSPVAWWAEVSSQKAWSSVAEGKSAEGTCSLLNEGDALAVAQLCGSVFQSVGKHASLENGLCWS